MSHRPNRACQVFVGNIPYDSRESELREIMSTVGPVVSCRIMIDKDSGRPKGFAFCEYRDFETAHSAMRNLNGRDYGGRPLRIDWADHEMKTSEGLAKVLERAHKDGAISSERAEKYVEEQLLKHLRLFLNLSMMRFCNVMEPYRQIDTLTRLEASDAFERGLVYRQQGRVELADENDNRSPPPGAPLTVPPPHSPSRTGIVGTVGTGYNAFMGTASHAYAGAQAASASPDLEGAEGLSREEAREAAEEFRQMSEDERRSILGQLPSLSDSDILKLPAKFRRQIELILEWHKTEE